MSISANMGTATEVILGQDGAMEKFDLSEAGFYASFKGLVVTALIDGVSMVSTHATRLRIEEATIGGPLRFALVSLFVAFCAYGASMVGLYLLCRQPQLQSRFSNAVILHNWASPVVSAAFIVPFFVLLTLQAQTHPEPAGLLVTIILLGSLSLLVMIGVRLLRVSLAISTSLAFGFFFATAAVSLVIEMWLSGIVGL